MTTLVETSPNGYCSTRPRLMPWMAHQVEWINATDPVCVWEKSRRAGADFAEAFRALRTRLSPIGVPRDYWYSSADESAAIEFMEYVKHFARAIYGRVVEIMHDVELFGDKEIRVLRIICPEVQGRRPRITAMSSNPRTFRSKGGDVCLSEFAHHDQAHEMWAAAVPVTTLGGSIRVLSTHKGVGSFFNRLVQGARRHRDGTAKPGDVRARLFRTTIHDAVANGLAKLYNALNGTDLSDEQYIDDLRSKCGDQLIWEEEFEVIASSDEESYFPYDLLRPCTREDDACPTDDLAAFLNDIETRAEGADALYAGVDVGRKRDRFVIEVDAQRGGMLRTAGVLVWHHQRFALMKGAIGATMRSPFGNRFVNRMCIDETGIGMQLAEEAHERFGYRVEPVTMTGKVKEALFPALRRRIEERTITVPDDAVYLADLNSIRKVVTTAQNIRYAADANEEGHADRAVAKALTVHAAESGRNAVRSIKVVGGVV